MSDSEATEDLRVDQLQDQMQSMFKRFKTMNERIGYLETRLEQQRLHVTHVHERNMELTQRLEQMVTREIVLTDRVTLQQHKQSNFNNALNRVKRDVKGIVDSMYGMKELNSVCAKSVAEQMSVIHDEIKGLQQYFIMHDWGTYPDC